MFGYLNKVDVNKESLSKLIEARFENHDGRIYFYSEHFNDINLDRNDYFFYTDNDLEINEYYQVQKIYGTMLEAKKVDL